MGIDYKLSEEAAAKQADSLLETYRMDRAGLDDATKSSIAKIERFLRLGQLSIDGNTVTQIVVAGKNKDTIIYQPLRGQDYMAMKDKGIQDIYGRVYALLGSMSGMGELGILKLTGIDLACANALGTFFLVAAS